MDTLAGVATLMAIPPDDPKLYRHAAFVLAPEQADKLITKHVMTPSPASQ